MTAERNRGRWRPALHGIAPASIAVPICVVETFGARRARVVPITGAMVPPSFVEPLEAVVSAAAIVISRYWTS